MDLRILKRYKLSDHPLAFSDIIDIHFEVDKNDKIKGKAVDISLCGMGVEIKDEFDDLHDEIEKLGDFFIKLYFGNESILVGVTKVWHKRTEDKGKAIFKGGIKFNIISPEDRLKLSNFIEMIRS